MGLRIVQKFGGTSVADIARLEKVALTVKDEVLAGHKVAVVVSAMAGVTNQLVGYAKSISASVSNPEYDAVVSSGEQITSGLLALALQQIGVSSRSFQGWQLPIITDDRYSTACIKRIFPDAIEKCWNMDIVPIISGFQGVTESGRITTLGRGGSDTSAVALAAALEADRCDIYTDVDGVFTADPRIVPQARKLNIITYEEMLELAEQGAKVLQACSVETAQRNGVNVRVLSSFTKASGTIVVPERDVKNRISGITHSLDWTRIRLKTETSPFLAESILRQVFDQNHVKTDMFLHSDLGVQESDVVFVVPQGDIPKAIKALDAADDRLRMRDLHVDSNVAKISIIGLNVRDPHESIAGKLVRTLKNQGIIAELIACSDLKFSVVVKEEHAEEAVRFLHQEFNLERE